MISKLGVSGPEVGARGLRWVARCRYNGGDLLAAAFRDAVGADLAMSLRDDRD